MSLIRRALALPERRAPGPYGSGDGLPGAYPWSPGAIPSNAAIPASSAGVPVNEGSALQLSAFYACVRLLADSISQLPWDAYRTQDGARVRVNPQPSLLRNPCSGMTVYDWKHQMVVSLAIRGNFYGYVVARDWRMFPTQVLPLHPDWVDIIRDPATGAKQVFVNGEPINPADLLHVRRFTLPGYDVGLSPLQVFRQSIGLGLAAEEFGGKWFRDGAAPSSTLETEQTLTDAQVKQAQQQWIATQGGRRLPAVLSGGFKWKPVTITPEESQFLETRKFQVSEIARMFGVPPHMIGDVERTTSWGSGIESMTIGFVVHTLGPWLACIESALNQTLVTPNGQFVKFSVEGLLRGDTKSRYEAYQMALDSGWMNPDEVRSLEDLPPIPGGAGAKYRQPLNFGPLGYEPAEPQPAPAIQADPQAD